MSKMGQFVAFEAAIQLLNERGLSHIIEDVYQKCKASLLLPKEEIVNHVKEIYRPFTQEEISAQITKIITPDNIDAEVQVIYQTLDNLHVACPGHSGDWYFSGDYPTPGGNKVVNKAFVNWKEGNNQRAY
jgi:amidophosphoribosyltransferase